MPSALERILVTIVLIIKEKPELHGLDDAFVLRHVQQYLAEHKRERAALEQLEGRPEKQIRKNAAVIRCVKAVRSVLRSVYGVFVLDPQKNTHTHAKQSGQGRTAGHRKGKNDADAPSSKTTTTRREQLLAGFKRHELTREAFDRELLALHQSTKERLPFYPAFYATIFGVTGIPRTLIDLGCGLNPCSTSFMMLAPRERSQLIYTAYELSPDDCTFLNAYFDAIGLAGNAHAWDALSPQGTADAARTFQGDIAFAFKLFDSLESVRKYSTAALLDRIHTTWIVASFPTKALGGKNAIRVKRTWFERLLARKNKTYTKALFDNEVVYIINNNH